MGAAAGTNSLEIGVISDTHGLVRPEALTALEGVSQIIHAGDVGGDAVLSDLQRVAPVTAVRGNMDSESWARRLPPTAVAEVGELLLYVLHDLGHLDLDPAAAGIAAVISGHSHIARVFEEKGVLYLNPGSAGPRRFGRPATLARVAARGRQLDVRIVTLTD
jgi:hypothetical protein